MKKILFPLILSILLSSCSTAGSRKKMIGDYQSIIMDALYKNSHCVNNKEDTHLTLYTFIDFNGDMTRSRFTNTGKVSITKKELDCLNIALMKLKFPKYKSLTSVGLRLTITDIRFSSSVITQI